MTNPDFPRTLSLLRQERGISQRTAARNLGISQALLSHYENGIREPGLSFVVRVCDYYQVSADYLLGRTLSRDGTTISTEDLYDESQEADHVLRGSVLATLSRKLIVNSIGILFDLLSRLGSRDAIIAMSNYFSTAVYKMFRLLYQTDPDNSPDFFALSRQHFAAGLPNADMICSESEFRSALDECRKEEIPPMTQADLAQTYPGAYQSLLQIIHSAGERIHHFTAPQGAEHAAR